MLLIEQLFKASDTMGPGHGNHTSMQKKMHHEIVVNEV